ncbi:tRNA (adenosine(37)-N6)-threonylcarbamoyltransferase complex dimerization subunit type 1 TsaB [Erythrobacter arachoides]|uniref:tRNA (Adenosine(37)-N6)-threonylcarbamoyltransferase complex dimerization subunit type 1 TsaB n=1 Tax=Aurantiacibacter arachoides TaxID=1850444 RepID=A0A845A0P9_9SPHN|nr:tRNA (adenosine(37)-N6)-threonylcarbamoyltransferase complex dimerization subunit type 1 TsaB [Aurantiacibacter arachoides]MXO93705.1 tRNA (adenosine(37)-N6)-threonylcarbamoyltransferase complex dimerization subunit type 1 TsaB [Aurantiacibacter arachoides]
MKTLAIDCATEACSVALFDGNAMIAGFCEPMRRGHAERLVPMIADLPERGRADRVLVSLGPGSFTGVRIGLAAARALGLAWGAEVLGYPTLALVAAMAQGDRPGEAVTVVMEGGHGQWFMQNFDATGIATDQVQSLLPEDADRAAQHRLVAGNRAPALAALPGGAAREALPVSPDARQALMLAPVHWRSDLAPLYGRGPDARLPAAKP